MQRNGLFVTIAADLLMLDFVDIREIAINMIVGCVNRFGRSFVTNRADNLYTAFFHTSGLFQNFVSFPFVRFCVFVITFGTNAAVDIIIFRSPFPIGMITGILNAGDTIVIVNFITGVVRITTIVANLIFVMGMT